MRPEKELDKFHLAWWKKFFFKSEYKPEAVYKSEQFFANFYPKNYSKFPHQG